MDAFFLSPTSMARNGDHISSIGALCALTSRIYITKKSLQALNMPSAKARSARASARLAAGQRVLRETRRSGSSSSSAAEESAGNGRPGRRPRAARRSETRNGELGDDGGTKAG